MHALRLADKAMTSPIATSFVSYKADTWIAKRIISVWSEAEQKRRGLPWPPVLKVGVSSALVPRTATKYNVQSRWEISVFLVIEWECSKVKHAYCARGTAYAVRVSERVPELLGHQQSKCSSDVRD